MIFERDCYEPFYYIYRKVYIVKARDKTRPKSVPHETKKQEFGIARKNRQNALRQ